MKSLRNITLASTYRGFASEFECKSQSILWFYLFLFFSINMKETISKVAQIYGKKRMTAEEMSYFHFTSITHPLLIMVIMVIWSALFQQNHLHNKVNFEPIFLICHLIGLAIRCCYCCFKQINQFAIAERSFSILI